MARIRTVKPAFFRHGGLYDLEQDTGLPIRVAFAGLWTAADKEGRFVWSPRTLKLDVLPYDNVDFSRVLDALTTRGFVVKYASDGRDFGFIPSWAKHQVINNKESPSVLPAPPQQIVIIDDLTRAPRVLDACPTPLFLSEGEYGRGKGKEGERISSNTEINPSAFGEISKARASRLPTDWVPSDQLALWFKTERPDLNLSTTVDHFRDYWHAKAGKGATKLNWELTFKNWARNQRAINGFAKPAAKKPPGYGSQPG